MLWAYDEAIANDLSNCIDPTGEANNTVKVMGDEGMIGVLAQIQDDRVTFPAIFLDRHAETPLDQDRYNFTRMHKGVPAVFDPETNNLYLEKAVPITLKYDLHILATRTAEMDEFMREILFRYSSMYYITMEVPYESKRKIRFGVAINPNTSINRKTGNADYLEGGKLYESIMELECQGAVLLHYTPKHLEGLFVDKNVVVKP